jgi:hypothetical protein
MTTARIRALCCECGNLRTVTANYKLPRDNNRSIECGDDPRGWRVTGTLKCAVCKAKTRHALLRDACGEYRDFAELPEHERYRAVIGQRVAESAPGYRIIERRRSAEPVRAGRHPGTVRELIVLNASGYEIASAFEYPHYWQIDVENHTIEIASMNPAWKNAGGLLRGFCVESEDAAYDWLKLFDALATKSAP